MSVKETERMAVMGLVEVGEMTLREAAAQMSVCHRQAKRIWARWAPISLKSALAQAVTEWGAAEEEFAGQGCACGIRIDRRRLKHSREEQ